MEYKTNIEADDERIVKKVRELATIMKEMDLTSLDVEHIVRIRMSRTPEIAIVGAASAPTVAGVPVAAEQPAEPQAKGTAVKSPMVGTFYSAAGSDKEPFVKIGQEVKTGDVLCIIEAMKMMNEITAECDGVITETCVENKALVEFGQVLFRIDTGA